MDRCDVSWAAGLFEGEGTIARLGGTRWQCAISMTDEDVLNRFWEIVRLGNTYGPYGYANGKNVRRAHHKKYWRWAVCDRDGILLFAEMMLPYLGARRAEKLKEALAEVRELKPRNRVRRFR